MIQITASIECSERALCAIVTGAAAGVGAELARAFAARGAIIIIADRDEVALARVRHDLAATAILCDVLDERSVTSLFDVVETAHGHIDLLINAAGSGYVRTLGVMRLSREFARRPRNERAVVVNLASRSDEGNDGFEYAGSQIAFSRLSEGLARAIETRHLEVLTIERVAGRDNAVDLADQLISRLSAKGGRWSGARRGGS